MARTKQTKRPKKVKKGGFCVQNDVKIETVSGDSSPVLNELVKVELKNSIDGDQSVNVGRKRNRKRKRNSNWFSELKTSTNEDTKINSDQEPVMKRIKTRPDKFKYEKNQQLVNINFEELYGSVKGRMSELVYSEDMSKKIDSLLSSGDLVIKNAVFAELKDEVLKMSQSKHAKVVVLSMLKRGKFGRKRDIFEVITKNLIFLINHDEGASVVDTVYERIANDFQQHLMINQFYGNSTLKEASPNQWPQLGFMKKTIIGLVNKTAFCHGIVLRVLRHYFNYCNKEEKQEMIDIIKERLVDICDIKDGNFVTLECIWNGSAKAHEAIVRSFSGKVHKEMCKIHRDQLPFLAILDCVHDVDLIMEVIIKEFIADLVKFVRYSGARTIVSYLMKGRNSADVAPSMLSVLESGDNDINTKNREKRQEELATRTGPLLAKFLVDNLERFLSNGALSHFIPTVVATTVDDFSQVDSEIIAKLADKPFELDGNPNSHLLHYSNGILILTKLIQQDKLLLENSKTQEKCELFCEKLLRLVKPTNFIQFARFKEGADILNKMCSIDGSIKVKVTEILKPVQEDLKNKEFAMELVKNFN